jgi:hypothetical protein
VTKIETESGSSGISFSDSTLSFSLTKTKQVNASAMSVTIGGNPYWVELGRLWMSRVAPSYFFLDFGQDFVADARLDVTRPATATATCTIRSKTFQTVLSSSTATVTVSHSGSVCQNAATSFLANIHYEAAPAIWVENASQTQVGQQFRHTFRVIQGVPNSADTSMKLASFTNWALSVAGSGTAAAGFAQGFDIGSTEQGGRTDVSLKPQTF